VGRAQPSTICPSRGGSRRCRCCAHAQPQPAGPRARTRAFIIAATPAAPAGAGRLDGAELVSATATGATVVAAAAAVASAIAAAAAGAAAGTGVGATAGAGVGASAALVGGAFAAAG